MNNKTIFDVAKSGTDFVGIHRDDYGNLIFTFPLAYFKNEEIKEMTKDALSKEFYKTLLAILRFAKKEFDRFNTGNMHIGIDIDSYIYVISNYINYGYYAEKEKVLNALGIGKFNIKKTLRAKKIFNDDGSIYFEKKYYSFKKNAENIITEIQKLCLEIIVNSVGDLLGSIFSEQSIYSSLVKMKSCTKYDFLIALLESKKINTFNDNKKRLFSSFISILKDASNPANDTSIIGTKKFEDVFEGMLNEKYGRLNPELYFPTVSFHNSTLSKTDSQHFQLRPDVISLDCKGKIIVLDAKYYSVGNVPHTYDFVKQMAYVEHICKHHSKEIDIDRNAINNFFILPNFLDKNVLLDFDINRYEQSNIDGGERKVYLVYVNMRKFMNEYTVKSYFPFSNNN